MCKFLRKSLSEREFSTKVKVLEKKVTKKITKAARAVKRRMTIVPKHSEYSDSYYMKDKKDSHTVPSDLVLTGEVPISTSSIFTLSLPDYLFSQRASEDNLIKSYPIQTNDGEVSIKTLASIKRQEDYNQRFPDGEILR